MRYTLLFTLMFGALISQAQTFWTEVFNNACASGCNATGYNGPNGQWVVTSSGTNDANGNLWYVSGAEGGFAPNSCGAAGSDQTLHIGASFLAVDPGAAYFADYNTALRAESPTINCTGKTGITIKFNYIENGEGTTDNATLWYYDGSSWSQLVDMPKTPTTCPSGQGLWTAYSIALPASANNNANVKIGFNWVNDDNGLGSDPSFAVDSVRLSTVAAGAAPVAKFSINDDNICIGDCATFTDLSTNTPTSWAWVFNGATPNSSTVQNPTFVCYSTAGTYIVKLTATNASGSDTETHVIKVNAKPIAHISAVGYVFTCSPTFPSYQWYKSGSPVAGTNVTYTATSNGIYYVKVTDANGCWAYSDSITVNTLDVSNVNAAGTGLELYPNPTTGTFHLTGAFAISDAKVEVEIMDLTGRVLQRAQYGTNNGALETNVILDANMPAGAYILKARSASTSYIKPFEKK